MQSSAAAGRRFSRGAAATGLRRRPREVTVFGLFTFIAATTTSANPSGLIITLVLMIGVFYLLLIRPQQRRAKQQKTLLSTVDVGDEVVTIGGMYGVITEVDEDNGELVVEISQGVEVRFLKAAIARKITPNEEPADEDHEHEHEPEEAGDQT
ncbi:MAG TPA: preprotein translocase subunit YajC [Actinobacteria bacterium]|jgi:preprotein translocase subunit YajC|nr:preprotein translocase subunit YajC [Actinomycetota bacterium]HCP61333.1 preprotein translocase subunit YajC [Actinomycetota bacterium]